MHSSESNGAAGSRTMRLAVFTKNFTNPAYAAARLGAERAAAPFGAQVLHFVPQTPDDPEEQSALIDQALALSPRPDAFVLSPVHPTRVDDAIRRVAAAGIALVGFINPVEAAPMTSYVGSDDYELAASIAEYLFAALGGRGRVLVVSGPVDSFTSQARLRGFGAAAQRHAGIELMGTIAGDYHRDTARERMMQWLRTHPAPDACIAANDIMAIGVLDALDAAGRHSLVVGVNAIPQAVRAIGAGRMLATADFNAMQIAFIATECAARHLRGEPVPATVELPVAIVHAGNWREWDRPYEERPLAGLDEVKT
jgi:ribose transport system substrate-binding protein